MEQTINIPIQMICICSTMGELTPVRFRYESDNHLIETISVTDILSHKETVYNGIKEIQYTCRANISNRSHMFIIVYNISSHKWRLFKMLT